MMMSNQKNNEITTTSNTNTNRVKKSNTNITHIDNTKQTHIEITEDRLELLVRDYEKELKAVKDWKTPFAVTITFLVAICTVSEFKSFGFISSEQLSGCFILATILCSCWSAQAAYFNKKSKKKFLTPKDFVKACEGESKEMKSITTENNNPK